MPSSVLTSRTTHACSCPNIFCHKKSVLAAGDLETRLAPLSSGDDWILQIHILFVVLVVAVDRA